MFQENAFAPLEAEDKQPIYQAIQQSIYCPWNAETQSLSGRQPLSTITNQNIFLSVDPTWKEWLIVFVTFRIFGLVSLISLLSHIAFLIEAESR